MVNGAVERLDSPHQAAAQELDHLVRAELWLETHHVTGIIDQSGRPRRLVDTLNAIDGPFVMVRDATVESLANPDEGERRFHLLHLKREAILLAIPLTNLPRSPDAEVLAKKSVSATLMLPGLEVTGHVYLPPEVDPTTVRMLGKDSFLPVTDAQVTQITHAGGSQREPLVVVNLGRALLYAPTPQ
ncbi:MAG: hypothetical protein V3S20_10015 [Dehalococcoidia bacterium]